MTIGVLAAVVAAIFMAGVAFALHPLTGPSDYELATPGRRCEAAYSACGLAIILGIIAAIAWSMS